MASETTKDIFETSWPTSPAVYAVFQMIGNSTRNEGEAYHYVAMNRLKSPEGD